MDLVDDGGWRPSGRHQRDPCGALVELGQLRRDTEARQVGKQGKRPIAVFCERAVVAALDQRQARPGAVEGEINRSREHGLADFWAALEWNELHVDARGLGKLERTKPRGDRARPMLSFPGLAFALAISSLIVLGPSLRTTTSEMVLINNVIGARPLSGS